MSTDETPSEISHASEEGRQVSVPDAGSLPGSPRE